MPRKRNQKRRKRKAKVPKGQRKPREKWIHLKATANAEGRVEFRFSDEGSLICPEAELGSVVSYRTYSRESGKPKVIARSPGLSFDLRKNIELSYDAIAGIDTNDFNFDGRHLSICSSFCSKPILKNRPDSIWVDIAPAFILEGVRENFNPEVIGWHLFLTHVLPLLGLSESQRLALVVDSELSNHIPMNQRRMPYFRNHDLPTCVDILYASSDTGDYLPNQLIKQCDKASRVLFSQICDGEIALPPILGGGTTEFAGYAYVNFLMTPYQIAKSSVGILGRGV